MAEQHWLGMTDAPEQAAVTLSTGAPHLSTSDSNGGRWGGITPRQEGIHDCLECANDSAVSVGVDGPSEDTGGGVDLLKTGQGSQLGV